MNIRGRLNDWISDELGKNTYFYIILRLETCLTKQKRTVIADVGKSTTQIRHVLKYIGKHRGGVIPEDDSNFIDRFWLDYRFDRLCFFRHITGRGRKYDPTNK